MALPLPTLRSTAQQALYPFKRTIKCNTLVSLSQDGSRQPSILDNPRVLFDLAFTKLNQTDKNSEKALAASAIGQAATNLSLTLGNVTYTNLSLDSDLYSGSVRSSAMWDTAFKLTQTIPQNLQPATTITANINSTVTLIPVASVAGFNGYITIGTETMLITDTPDSAHFTVTRGALGTTAASHTSGAAVVWGPGWTSGQAFPSFPNATRTQIPWQQNQQYKTEVSSLEAGPKYTFPWYGGHLDNFPTSGLRQWQVGGDMLTDAETALLEAHFLANWGRMFSFSFTDPETGTVYTDAYYTTDELTIEYVQPNVNRVRLNVESYNQGIAVASAVLHVWTDFTQTLGGAFERVDYFNGSTSANLLSTSTNHALTENVFTLSIPNGIRPLTVSFFPYNTILENPADVTQNVYDCWIFVTYTDGSTANLRPSSHQILIADPGTITNPQLAYDADSNPPVTFATIHRTAFDPLGGQCILTLSGFFTQF